MLTRPNAYLVVATVAIVALIKAGWRPATRLLLVAVLITVPWVIRNEIQVGTPDLVTSDGFTLAAIFAEPAQKQNGFVDPVFDPAYENDLDLKLSQFDESVWSNKLLHRAWDGVRSNPRYLVTNARRNVANLLELSDNDGPERLDGRNIDFRHATLPMFYVVTVAGLAGLWLHRRDWRVRLLAVLAAEFALLMILILAPPRLRAPVDVICCIGVGLAVASLRTRYREGQRREPERVSVTAQNLYEPATGSPRSGTASASGSGG